MSSSEDKHSDSLHFSYFNSNWVHFIYEMLWIFNAWKVLLLILYVVKDTLPVLIAQVREAVSITCSSGWKQIFIMSFKVIHWSLWPQNGSDCWCISCILTTLPLWWIKSGCLMRSFENVNTFYLTIVDAVVVWIFKKPTNKAFLVFQKSFSWPGSEHFN